MRPQPMQDNFGADTMERDGILCGALLSSPWRVFLISLLLLTLTGGSVAVADVVAPPPAVAAASDISGSCQEFDRLNSLIRDGALSRESARSEIPRVLTRIKAQYQTAGGKNVPRSEWLFPLKGYTVTAVGGGRSHGYLPQGYSYYDGNRHGGHPALDIFINDRNQDDRDDLTGEYVPVVSVAGGVVVAREGEWLEGSTLRGGKYLWVYDPSTDHLFYYAHLREVAVTVGTLIAPGQPLGLVGRSGLNAQKRRSPTHLHITCLSTSTPSLLSENIYPDLVRAPTVK